MYHKYNFYYFIFVCMKEKCVTPLKLWGSVTVGPKWQVVIPKEVRDLLGISPWDTLVTITKGSTAVWFLKNTDMEAIIEYVHHECNR